MKKILLIQLLLLLVLGSNGQDRVISFAPTLNNAFHYQFVSGGASRNSKPGLNIGFEYVKSTTNRVSYGYGLGYQWGRVGIVPAPMIEGEPHNEAVNLLSASFKLVFNFRKNFYLSTDPLVDLQLHSPSQKNISNQTGLGISVGFGKRILFNNRFSIRIEPRLWVHNVVPFVDATIPDRLTAIGLKVGLKLGSDK